MIAPVVRLFVPNMLISDPCTAPMEISPPALELVLPLPALIVIAFGDVRSPSVMSPMSDATLISPDWLVILPVTILAGIPVIAFDVPVTAILPMESRFPVVIVPPLRRVIPAPAVMPSVFMEPPAVRSKIPPMIISSPIVKSPPRTATAFWLTVMASAIVLPGSLGSSNKRVPPATTFRFSSSTSPPA